MSDYQTLKPRRVRRARWRKSRLPCATPSTRRGWWDSNLCTQPSETRFPPGYVNRAAKRDSLRNPTRTALLAAREARRQAARERDAVKAQVGASPDVAATLDRLAASVKPAP